MQINIKEELLIQFNTIDDKNDIDLLQNFQRKIPNNVEPLEELFPYYWKVFEEKFLNNFKDDNMNKSKNTFEFTLKSLVSIGKTNYFFRGITDNPEEIILGLKKNLSDFSFELREIINNQIDVLSNSKKKSQ